MSLSGNVEGSVELNYNMLCIYGLSKGCDSGMTEYINLELSGNDKGDDQLTKKAIFANATTTAATAASTATTSTTTTTTTTTKTTSFIVSTNKAGDIEKKSEVMLRGNLN